MPGPAAVGANNTQSVAAKAVRAKFIPVKYQNPVQYLRCYKRSWKKALYIMITFFFLYTLIDPILLMKSFKS